MRIYVAEVRENKIQNMRTYPDTPPGQGEAKDYFKSLIEENGGSEKEQATAWDEGYFEQGDWTICWGSAVGS